MLRCALLARHVLVPIASLRVASTSACSISTSAPSVLSHDVNKLTAALDSSDALTRTRALVRLRRLLIQSTRRPSEHSLPLSLVQRLADEYEALPDNAARYATLHSIATELGDIDWTSATQSASSFAQLPEPACDNDLVRRLNAADSLRTATTPPYVQLFNMLANHHSHGVAFLVRWRRDLLALLSSKTIESYRPQDVARLRSMNECLRQTLAVLFCVSNLRFRRITWDSMSTSLRDFIVRSEAVHSVSGIADLQRRFGPGRRVFAFFHSAMPADRPLVFVNVALTETISDNVQHILQVDPPADCEQRASCAIFYSITSAEPGLAGVELGTHLIKHAVKHVQNELPAVQTFSTLSPIPGFRKWLDTQLVPSKSVLSESEKQAIHSLGCPTNQPAELYLQRLLSNPASLQHDSVRAMVLRLCARYVVAEKKRRAALDPVTNFHVRNGATVYRLNWGGDSSAKGFAQSLGVMANYRYELDQLQHNHQQYVEHGRVPMSPDVAKLAQC